MAKKNNKSNRQSSQISPEKYLLSGKARQLEIGTCYKSDGMLEYGLGIIIVTRKHKSGNVTVGAYLLDTFCLGVKDTYCYFSISQAELEEYIAFINKTSYLVEIPYVEAHNLIYGGVEFAEEGGIAPHINFKSTQYILEPDDEDIPIIEYDFGDKGVHHLVVHSAQEADVYESRLKAALGSNYRVTITELDKLETY